MVDSLYQDREALALRPSGQTRPSPSLMSGIDDKLAERVMAAGMKQGPVYSQTQMWAQLGTAAIGGIFKGIAAEKKGEILQRLSAAMEGANLDPQERREIDGLLKGGYVSLAVKKTDQAKRRMAAREDAAAKIKSEERIAAAKPPETRKFTVEDKRGRQRIITKEWDRENRVWKQIYSAPRSEETKTPLQKNIESLGYLPGSSEYKKLMLAGISGKEFSIRATKDGIDITYGPGMGQPWGKKATGTIESQILAASDGLRRLTAINEAFNPEMLTFGAKMEYQLLNFIDKIGFTISASDKLNMGDTAVFRRNAYEALNKYIKDITGAQMSDSEAKRLTKAFTDPEGDGPTVFKSKLDDLIKTTRETVARLSYLRHNGIMLDKSQRLWKGRNKKGVIVNIPGVHNGLREYVSPMSKIMENKYQATVKRIRKLRPNATIETIKELATINTMDYFGLLLR
jgi:hypothetical protein